MRELIFMIGGIIFAAVIISNIIKGFKQVDEEIDQQKHNPGLIPLPTDFELNKQIDNDSDWRGKKIGIIGLAIMAPQMLVAAAWLLSMVVHLKQEEEIVSLMFSPAMMLIFGIGCSLLWYFTFLAKRKRHEYRLSYIQEQISINAISKKDAISFLNTHPKDEWKKVAREIPQQTI